MKLNIQTKIDEILNNDIYRQLIQVGPEYQEKKRNKAPYKPKQATIDKITITKKDIEDCLWWVSPFSKVTYGLSTIEEKFIYYVTKTITFSPDQINRMSLEMKKLIINKILKETEEHLSNVEKTLWFDEIYSNEVHRILVVSEEYYEENKLKIEVDFSGEFTIFKKEYFDVFEKALLKAVKFALESALGMNDYNLKEGVEIVPMIWKEVLKVIPFSGNALLGLRDVYLWKLEKGMTDEEVEDFKQFKISPFDGWFGIENGFPDSSFGWRFIQAFSNDFSLARRIFKKEKVEELVSYILFFAERLVEKEKEKMLKPTTNLLNEEIKRLIDIISNIPKIKEILEKDETND